MKKITFYLLTVSFLLGFSTQLQANEKETKATTEKATVTEIAEVNKMVDRLNEIKEMDFKEMTSAEKKELRKEVRSIRSDLKAIAKSDSNSEAKSAAEDRGGFYISTGAAIIIVLLLIILL